MKRYIILSLVVFVAAFGSTFWTMSIANKGRSGGDSADPEAYRLLHREAELVAHFCLSRIPPVLGSAAIPNEWEKALGSSIRLREGAGEAVSESAALAARVSDIQKLETGQSVAVTAQDGNGARHWLVYKPASSGNLLLVLSKSDATAAEQMQARTLPNPWLMSVAIGLVLALIAAISSRLIFPPLRNE